ncbi:MAG: hypothetical protein ACOC00_08465, partial [Halothiobacillaceae bacterium]
MFIPETGQHHAGPGPRNDRIGNFRKDVPIITSDPVQDNRVVLMARRAGLFDDNHLNDPALRLSAAAGN